MVLEHRLVSHFLWIKPFAQLLFSFFELLILVSQSAVPCRQKVISVACLTQNVVQRIFAWRGFTHGFSAAIWSSVQRHVHGFNSEKVRSGSYLVHITEKSMCVYCLPCTDFFTVVVKKVWWISERKLWKHNEAYLALLTHQKWETIKTFLLSLSPWDHAPCQSTLSHSELLNVLRYYDHVTDGREQDSKGIWLYPEKAILKYGEYT